MACQNRLRCKAAEIVAFGTAVAALALPPFERLPHVAVAALEQHND
jgi:hypothetical protein